MNCDCVIINDLSKGTQSIDYCEMHSGKAVERLVEAAKPFNRPFVMDLEEISWEQLDALEKALAPFQKPQEGSKGEK